MKTLQTLLLALSTSLILGMGSIMAQAPALEWQKSLGGSGGEIAKNIQLTTDGGYIVLGDSSSADGNATQNHGNVDYWLVKLDASGTIEWQKSLGGTGMDEAESVQQTADGDYIVAGYSESNDNDVTGNHGNYDYWIVKLSSNGTIQWQKSFGGTESDAARSIKQTGDGGYLVAGQSSSTNGDVIGNHGNSDYWIVKLNTTGNIVTQTSYGGSASDSAKEIQPTTDGGFIVAGHSSSTDGDVTGNHGSNDFWIIKIGQMGSILWQKSFGGSGSDTAESIKQTADGGYIVAGRSYSTDGDVTGNHGGSDCWVVKLDPNGNLEWQKSLGGSGFDDAYEVQIVNGGYVIAGLSDSNDGDVTGNHGNLDYWIVKLDETGSLQWQKSLGGSTGDGSYSIRQTIDNGFIVAGGSGSNDGDVSGNHGNTDYWIVKLEPDPLGIAEFSSQISIYPNPVASILNIAAKEPIKSVSVFNQLGQQVMTTKYSENMLELDISELSPNLYFVRVSTEKTRETFRIVVR